MKRRTPTLASKIQQTLLDEIHAGQLLPGYHLEEIELAARYNVSRTPVREALRQLSALGIVKITPRQGAIVVDHSEDHRKRETLEVIADLEAAAARYAALRIGAEGRENLQKLADDMQQAAQQNNHLAFDALNLDLHHCIHQAAGNSLLLDQIANLRMRTLPYTRTEHMSQHTPLHASQAEHTVLIKAILRGDGEMAYHAMRFHVIQAGEQVEDLLAGSPAGL